ncbi:hypothetical protein RSAG8_05886, partial [Rhizoctonia solani AG-8 WAC10335]
MEAGVYRDLRPESNSRYDQLEHIQVADNYNPPINSLPTEILLHIFNLARYLWWRVSVRRAKGAEDSTWDNGVQNLMSLPYPEVLSHVCSLWRQIVLSSPSLWSHIDIYTVGQSSQVPLSRSSAFLARAQGHELMLKCGPVESSTPESFGHNAHHPSSDWTATDFFCSAVGPRLKSLRVDNHAPDTTLFYSIFQGSLSHARPGILADLTIADKIPQTIRNPGDNSEGLAGWTLPPPEHFGMSQPLLDDIVQSIRILRLDGHFFPWASPAYHGLVDLRLSTTRPKRGHRPFIQAAQLREILLACPKLRALDFGIKINGQNSQATLSPVPLNDLEVLNIRHLSLVLYEEFLPLLAPSGRPLKLMCQTRLKEEPTPYCPALLAFFQRSKVTRLYITNRAYIDYHRYFPLEHLLINSPTTLHTLGLERFNIIEHLPSRIEHLKAMSPIKLDCLCLRRCTIVTGVLQDVAIKLPAQILKLQAPEFKDTPDEAPIREEIGSMFPTVKWVHLAMRAEKGNLGYMGYRLYKLLVTLLERN